jgi:dihydroorotate dehydrogenase electron transfer subunit
MCAASHSQPPHAPPAEPGHGAFQPSVVAEGAVILSHEAVNGEYRHMRLACGPVAASAAPGQFFQLLCPAPPGEAPFLRRPMSVYGADPATGTVEFLRC